MNREQDFYPQALSIAYEIYAHKTRSGGVRPYVEHPLMLVEILCAHGFKDDVLLSGAVLHDAIEENNHSQDVVDRLKGECPLPIFLLIQEVTDTEGLEREARRVEQIQRAKGYSTMASLVRLADKLANMRDILSNPPRWAPRHIVSYCDFAMKVVEVCRPASPAIADECANLFEQVLHRYAKPRNPENPSQSPS